MNEHLYAAKINGKVNKGFHTYWDEELIYWPQIITSEEQRTIVVQERSVNYRFALHQHPYVRELTQRLLQLGVNGLQAADTDYTPDGASLAGSMEVMLPPINALEIASGARIAMIATAAGTAEGAPIELEKDLELTLPAKVLAGLPGGMYVALLKEMAPTQPRGSEFTLDAVHEAIAYATAKVTLAAGTQAMLGALPVTFNQDTDVELERGAKVTLPAGTSVTMVKSKRKPRLYAEFFDKFYSPNDLLVQRPYPVKDLDFTPNAAYGVYNWELFFHVPLTIAIHLSKNQRFAEAQRWFHYLFDPTDDSNGPTPERFWKVRPFQYTDVRKIEEILLNLATGDDETLRAETSANIQSWQDAPFRPHVVARMRQQAYMYKTVMAYLDNLIAWGDSLFRQDTGEAIDEAMMLYVTAANILGPRPQAVPAKGSVRPQTYAELRKGGLKEFGSALRSIEADLPFDLLPLAPDGGGSGDQMEVIRSIGKTLYFCVPRNDKLLGYWDTVADRLFKIRNSLNIRGVFRRLALFEPPIDPAMLARAAAAGLDVGAVVSGLNQPLPLVRFQLLAQKAAEVIQEVKTLGSSLLSAIEKEDGEAMSLLRARHERAVLEMVEHIKYGQLQEAVKSREGLLKSLELAVQRYTYYELQLGKKADEIQKAIPQLEQLDAEGLAKMKFAMQEPSVGLRDLAVDIAQDLGESGGKIVSSHERSEFESLESATTLRAEAANLDMIAKVLSLIPELGGQAQPMGVGAAIQFGGRALSTQLSLASDGTRIQAERENHNAAKSSKIGGYARRELDWAFQSNLAAGEIGQIFKQLRAAELREAVAKRELDNHRRQIRNAEEVEFFLTGEKDPTWTQPLDAKEKKTTNRAFYAWMKREVKGLYGQCFQFAFDTAKKAERALQHELGDPSLSYLQFGYLAGKEGLLAGEKLYLDLKRMEMAFLELNQREYELTKHVSLLQVDPLALIQLRATGRCTVRLGEEIFDLDGPGHYFRRIKSVAVSIPCVTGPYVGVNCTLTLLKSSIRRSPLLQDGLYGREGSEDSRFDDYFGSLQSVVTSSGQSDSGLFETNLRDERYLPFEYAGAVSEWQLQLPANPSRDEPCQFDYNTISDVILHIRYTAREGGGLLRQGAIDHLEQLIGEAQAGGCVRLFSLRHEFPSEWARFLGQNPDAGGRRELSIKLREEHYPFWFTAKPKAVTRSLAHIELYARSNATNIPTSLTVFAGPADAPLADKLEKLSVLDNLLFGVYKNIPLPPEATGDLKLYFDTKELADLWIVVKWKV
jgi:hypothetical protein